MLLRALGGGSSECPPVYVRALALRWRLLAVHRCESMLNDFPLLIVASRWFPLLPVASRGFSARFRW